MPRAGSIAGDIVVVLKDRRGGATLPEIREAVGKRRGAVLPHSVRSALYQHLGDSGERLFVKLDDKRPARYGLRR